MNNNPNRVNQYIGAIGATVGGFALGTVIGWSSPANSILEENLSLTNDELTWVSSIMPIGAALAQIYMVLTLNRLGNKKSMLIIAWPFTAGWIILAFAKTALWLCIGRVTTGFCGGCFCVAAPSFIGEIADKNIRGTLSTFFQLFLTIGIFVSYTLGLFKNIFILTLPLCGGPIIVFCVMIFLPDSPIFLYQQGQTENAKKSLRFYRGPYYDIDSEIAEITEYTKNTGNLFWKNFNTKASKKAFLILLGMHSIQQLSGINAVMFFAQDIFAMAGSQLGPEIDAIVLATVQVFLTGVSAYLIDISGRKKLWILSLSIMALCLINMGILFYIRNAKGFLDEKLTFLPLVTICIYLSGFSLGSGPLPWVMIAEFLPNSIKCYVAPFITFINWILAFTITKSFIPLKDLIGADCVFYLFAMICVLGLTFVMLYVIETKNKTLEEIQKELKNNKKCFSLS